MSIHFLLDSKGASDKLIIVLKCNAMGLRLVPQLGKIMISIN